MSEIGSAFDDDSYAITIESSADLGTARRGKPPMVYCKKTPRRLEVIHGLARVDE